VPGIKKKPFSFLADEQDKADIVSSIAQPEREETMPTPARTFETITSSGKTGAQANGETATDKTVAPSTEESSFVQKVVDKVVDHAPEKVQEKIGHETSNGHAAENGVHEELPKAHERDVRPSTAVPEKPHQESKQAAEAVERPSTAAHERKGIWGSIRRHISLRK
jgi:hypothetical protein